MTPEYIELDLMVAELETENRMMRARNERLEKELAAAIAERDEFKTAVERIVSISQLAFRNCAIKGISQVGEAKQTAGRTRAFLEEGV